MNTAQRLRIAGEAALAALSAVALVLTLTVPDWIERTTGASPDGGDGGAEWFLTAAACVTTVVFAGLAAWEWRRLRTA